MPKGCSLGVPEVGLRSSAQATVAGLLRCCVV